MTAKNFPAQQMCCLLVHWSIWIYFFKLLSVSQRLEEEEVDSESEYETTDDETDDEDQDRCGYSCPFCLEVFHTRETAQRHMELHHGNETEGEM